MSTRLASLAMDTDDIDCVYYIAYPEIIWGIFRVGFVARYLELASEVVLEPTLYIKILNNGVINNGVINNGVKQWG
jgi:hypothetical protein